MCDVLVRTILIGDVHGCIRELDDLLERLGPVAGDRLVFVGDLVARGPDTRGVLRRLRELRAECVIGNHEEKLLAARRLAQKGASARKPGSHQALLAELGDADWAQLEALPLKLDLGEHGLRVVHAGVVPGLAWEKQDPWMVTHIRSIADDGSPSERHGVPWGTRYAGPPHVVFGHNAQRAPQIHEYATGIDTACVYGGELTALVLPAGTAPPPRAERRDALVCVKARRAYADYGRDLPS